MRKATVQLLLEVDVVKGVCEVGPIEVSIHSEHLSEDDLAYIDKFIGKSGSLARPVCLSRVGQLRQRGVGNG